MSPTWHSSCPAFNSRPVVSSRERSNRIQDHPGCLVSDIYSFAPHQKILVRLPTILTPVVESSSCSEAVHPQQLANYKRFHRHVVCVSKGLTDSLDDLCLSAAVESEWVPFWMKLMVSSRACWVCAASSSTVRRIFPQRRSVLSATPGFTRNLGVDAFRSPTKSLCHCTMAHAMLNAAYLYCCRDTSPVVSPGRPTSLQALHSCKRAFQYLEEVLVDVIPLRIHASEFMSCFSIGCDRSLITFARRGPEGTALRNHINVPHRVKACHSVEENFCVILVTLSSLYIEFERLGKVLHF